MPVLSRRVRAVGLISSSVCAVFMSVACGPATPPVARSSGQATADTTIPSGPYGDAARRGRALLTATRDSLPAHVGNKLRCTSCHLDAGRRETAGSWLGAFARYPQYRARSGVVETIEYRVNDCFRRSMNGTALDPGGGDMRDIVAYLAFLSRGIVVSPVPANSRLQKWAAFKADTAAGARVFAATCAKCHGVSGEGTAVAPPLWGAQSYNIGAGMSRVRTAAEFISRNMPFDAPGTLADSQAFNVAAYINARPRPDFKGKENDWPNGDPPPDVAYPTRVHH
jgi:thiosulfate dehydrogenase